MKEREGNVLRADRIRLIFVIIVLLAAFIGLFWPTAGKEYTSFFDRMFGNIRLGLDIKGGSRLDYAIKLNEDSDKTISEVADQVVVVVRQRLDSANYTEATVQKVGSGVDTRLRVEIPGVEDPAVAERLVGKKGKLYFFNSDYRLTSTN